MVNGFSIIILLNTLKNVVDWPFSLHKIQKNTTFAIFPTRGGELQIRKLIKVVTIFQNDIR